MFDLSNQENTKYIYSFFTHSQKNIRKTIRDWRFFMEGFKWDLICIFEKQLNTIRQYIIDIPLKWKNIKTNTEYHLPD